MLKREKYLNQIRGFYHNTELIKIIYGLRRIGKSVILEQIMEEIRESGVDDGHIIYMNFESLKYSSIKNALDLDIYIKSLAKDNKIHYVFLDEIQKVEDFDKAINSLRVENNFSIFATGSNSRVTVMELSTELTRKIC
jgi:predicted AAA+ superfamily ATPase